MIFLKQRWYELISSTAAYNIYVKNKNKTTSFVTHNAEL